MADNPGPSDATAAFLAARDLLLDARIDYGRAVREFQWPVLDRFNWALDYFDYIARANDRPALHVVDEGGTEHKQTFAELSAGSNRVANYLRGLGAVRGDCLLLMLGNQVELWETLLASMKLGLVTSPASTLLTTADLQDRVNRGRVRFIVAGDASVAKFETVSGDFRRIAVGRDVAGWERFDESLGASCHFEPEVMTAANDPLLLYFTSGTTSKPKLVIHTHQSYPVGHLSTLYWIGLQRGDRHWNISSPGWAKHAWSWVFAPWNAEATVFSWNYARFNAAAVLEALVRHEVTALCAPPTVWRMLVQEPLEEYRVALREVVSAGEPLNPEVVDRVRKAWDLTIRDGYGQTETTAVIGNPPGPRCKPGSMGRPLPGYRVVLDSEGRESDTDGEICLPLEGRSVGLTDGYADDAQKTSAAMRGGYYHTGDIATREADGYFTFVGRTDDVFKASDYRVSPFELESALLEHAAVAEAAVVPSPDPVRHAVPKAFIVLAAGFKPGRALASEIFAHCRATLAPYKRVRRLEFSDLPKTISGKIRRVELRTLEERRRAGGQRGEQEFLEEEC